MIRKGFLAFLALSVMVMLPAYVWAQAVLIDQPTTSTNTAAYPSLLHNPAHTEGDVFLADDFSTNSQTWDISKIFIPGNFRPSYGSSYPDPALPDSTLLNANTLRFEIWGNNTGIPSGNPGTPPIGSPVWNLSVAPDDARVTIEAGSDGYGSNVTLDLTQTVRLVPGTYWLIFYPEIDAFTYSRYGRQVSATTNGFAAQIIVPGGSDPAPTSWTALNSLTVEYPELAGEQDLAFQLTGFVATPGITVTSSSLDFGQSLFGSPSSTREITMTSSGRLELNVTTIGFTGTNANMFAVATGGTCGSAPFTLASGESCSLIISFTHDTAGINTATLQVVSNDPVGPTNIALTGEVLVPNIVVAPETLDFANVLVDEASLAQTVTITNTGTANLSITSAITGTSETMFLLASGSTNGCSVPSYTLIPDEACTLSVTFSPNVYGLHNAILEISSDDPETAKFQVGLSGNAVYEVTPSVLEGTVGTEITFGGGTFGTKKGKVLIGDVASKKAVKAKIASGDWTNGQIKCTVNKTPLPGETAYDVTIQQKPKGTAPIVLPRAFTVKKPEINESTSDSNGAPEAEATIKGMWFGTKKGKVYLGEQKCKVKSWAMDPATGESTIVFVVHKKIGAASYLLRVENKIGRSISTTPFEVP